MARQRRVTRAASRGLIHAVQEEDHTGEQEGTSAVRPQDQPQTTAPDIQVAVNAAIQQFSPAITTLMTAVMEMQKSIQAMASQQTIAPVQPHGPELALDVAQAPVSRPPPPQSTRPLAVGLATSSPHAAAALHPVMPSRRPQADLGPVLQQTHPVLAPRRMPARSSSETHDSIEMEPNPYSTEQHQTNAQAVDMSRPTTHAHIQLPPQAPVIYQPSVAPVHQVAPSGGSGARGIPASHHPLTVHDDPSPNYVTRSDLETLIHRLSQNSTPHPSAHLTGHAPYVNDIATIPYPPKYKQPAFVLFNGREGNAREHLTRFAGSLEQYGPGDSLKLREFHKSLTGLAYTWYHQIPAGTVHAWNDMVQLFLDKFHYEAERVSVVDIAGIRQNQGEDLNEYVHRFHLKCLECTDFSKDETLVPICIKNMTDIYRVHIENLQLRSWGHLKETARRTYETVGHVKPWRPCPQNALLALADTFDSQRNSNSTSNNNVNNHTGFKRQFPDGDQRPDKRRQQETPPAFPRPWSASATWSVGPCRHPPSPLPFTP